MCKRLPVLCHRFGSTKLRIVILCFRVVYDDFHQCNEFITISTYRESRDYKTNVACIAGGILRPSAFAVNESGEAVRRLAKRRRSRIPPATQARTNDIFAFVKKWRLKNDSCGTHMTWRIQYWWWTFKIYKTTWSDISFRLCVYERHVHIKLTNHEQDCILLKHINGKKLYPSLDEHW